MNINIIDGIFSICRVKDLTEVDFSVEFVFVGKTDEEISLVCLSDRVPKNVIFEEKNWRALRIEGMLDFSLTGILSFISGVLADKNIGIFAVSTYNTDYIFVKAENIENAVKALDEKGIKLSEKSV